jgi:hypothetical protein
MKYTTGREVEGADDLNGPKQRETRVWALLGEFIFSLRICQY